MDPRTSLFPFLITVSSMIDMSKDDLPQPTYPMTAKKSPFFISMLMSVKMFLSNDSVSVLKVFSL